MLCVTEFSAIYYIYHFYLITNPVVLRDVCLRTKNYNEKQRHGYYEVKEVVNFGGYEVDLINS